MKLEKEDKMTADEVHALGITTKNGIKYDRYGNMIWMSRPDLQNRIEAVYEKFYQLNDQTMGLNEQVYSHYEMIKGFNKKLANGKADT
jgi:hypothetical protein